MHAVNMAVDEEGICTACQVAEQFAQLDDAHWERRKKRFEKTVASIRGNNEGEYDCLIPDSGGKDSYFQTHKMIVDYGLKPLLVTYHGNNVVCSFEVIEHVFDPASMFRAFHRILKPGGLTIVTNPNGQGFDVVTAPQFSSTVDVEHLNYFNPDSMRIMFERVEFELVETSTPGVLDAELVRRMFTSGQLRREDNPFLYEILVDKWEETREDFQSFLVTQKLSSHMWTIARKV